MHKTSNNSLLLISLVFVAMALAGCGKGQTSIGGVAPGDGNQPVAIESQISFSSPNIADAETATVIYLVLRSSSRRPVSGFRPVLTVSGRGNVVGTCSKTDAKGHSTCTLVSSIPEMKWIEVVGLTTSKDTLKVGIEFTAPLHQAALMALVPMADEQSVGGTHQILASMDYLQGEMNLQDGQGNIRLRSTHMATLLGED